MNTLATKPPPMADNYPIQGVNRSVSIPAAGITLRGDLIIPTDASGLVLFAHGSGSSRYSPRNQFVARQLQESGFGTLLFDLLTPAEENEDALKSHLRFDIALLAERLVLATRWVNHHRELKHLPIGYFGASTGAAAALVAAAEVGSVVGAVVSRGGRPDLAEARLAEVRAATLLIVGERDEVVLGMNDAALQKLNCEKSLVTVPHATHLFQERGALEQVAALAANWFALHLTPPGK